MEHMEDIEEFKKDLQSQKKKVDEITEKYIGEMQMVFNMYTRKINSNKNKITELILSVIIISLTISIVSADTENPFGTAISIDTGTYSGKLGKEQTISYVVQGRSGHELVAEITGKQSSGDYYWSLELYNDDREYLTHRSLTSMNSDVESSLSWLSAEDTVYYLVLKSNKFSITGSYSLKVSFIPRYDANSGRDAGNTPEDAIRISQGTYKGFLAKNIRAIYKYAGDDTEDFYVLHLDKGQKVNVKITPEIDCAVPLHILNKDQKLVSEDKPRNKGAIVKASWTAPSSQDIYILINWNAGMYKIYPGPYSLDVSIEGPTATPTTVVPKATTKITAKTTPKTTTTVKPTDINKEVKEKVEEYNDSITSKSEDKQNVPGFDITLTVTVFLIITIYRKWI